MKLSASKRIAPTPGTPFDDLTSHLTADVTDLHGDAFAIDSVKLDVETHNDLVALHTLEVHRAENSVTAKATYRIPKDLGDAASGPVDAQFVLDLPKLEAFAIKVANKSVVGPHARRGNGKDRERRLARRARSPSAWRFPARRLRPGALTANVKIADSVAQIEQLTLQLNGTDQLAITGQGDVRGPFPYDASLLLDIKNLAAFSPLLTVFGVKQPIAGTLHLDWSGKGETAPINAAREAPNSIKADNSTSHSTKQAISTRSTSARSKSAAFTVPALRNPPTCISSPARPALPATWR